MGKGWRIGEMPSKGGAEQGLPPEYSLNHDRCIVHFDIDCFYAQASKRRTLELVNSTLGVRPHVALVVVSLRRGFGVSVPSTAVLTPCVSLPLLLFSGGVI